MQNEHKSTGFRCACRCMWELSISITLLKNHGELSNSSSSSSVRTAEKRIPKCTNKEELIAHETPFLAGLCTRVLPPQTKLIKPKIMSRDERDRLKPRAGSVSVFWHPKNCRDEALSHRSIQRTMGFNKPSSTSTGFYALTPKTQQPRIQNLLWKTRNLSHIKMFDSKRKS